MYGERVKWSVCVVLRGFRLRSDALHSALRVRVTSTQRQQLTSREFMLLHPCASNSTPASVTALPEPVCHPGVKQSAKPINSIPMSAQAHTERAVHLPRIEDSTYRALRTAPTVH